MHFDQRLFPYCLLTCVYNKLLDNTLQIVLIHSLSKKAFKTKIFFTMALGGGKKKALVLIS